MTATHTPAHAPWCLGHDDVTDSCISDVAATAAALLWADTHPSGAELHLMPADPARPYSPDEWRALIASMQALLATVDQPADPAPAD